MKKCFKPSFEAMTLIEVLVVIAVLSILAAILLPMRNKPDGSPVVHCSMHLRNIGLGFAMFASERSDRFPSQVSITNGGAMELSASNSPALYFKTLSRHLVNPRELVCVEDKSRTAATNFDTLSNTNISYFFSLDATSALPNAILSGDRNVEVAGQAVKPGLLMLTTNVPVSWTREMHTRTAGSRRGNMLFVDGHVETLHTNSAMNAIQRQGLMTNRLVFP